MALGILIVVRIGEEIANRPMRKSKETSILSSWLTEGAFEGLAPCRRRPTGQLLFAFERCCLKMRHRLGTQRVTRGLVNH